MILLPEMVIISN